MHKRLSLAVLLLSASLYGMEKEPKAGQCSDRKILAHLSQLLENRQILGAEGHLAEEEEGSPIKGVPKEVTSSLGELPLGSEEELPGLSESDGLKARIFTLLEEKQFGLERKEQEKLVEEIFRRLLSEKERGGLEENASDQAALRQTGLGGGCLIYDRTEAGGIPGGFAKHSASRETFFP